ncbi:hypothetical protein AAG570_013978 [Ranatra chinensis]|uniref:C2H2-type domain-containing protein n=1 Tax=Ranatra chinensis TaxID=642074 RepID=A0ABD0YDW6_9HEMI
MQRPVSILQRGGKQLYGCKNCGKSYQRSTSLMRHVGYECGKEPQFWCSYCPHRAKQKAALKKHIEEMHNPNPYKFFCQQCGYKSKRKLLLNSIGGSQFFLGVAVLLNEVIGFGAIHECSTCGKRYRHVESLSRHVGYECGKDPQFQCSQCPHRCKQKASLKKHLEEMHNPDPYKFFCQHCGGTPPFVTCQLGDQRQSTLYECKTCGKNYQRSTSLLRHVEYECGKEPQFQCQLCSYRAKQKSHLKRHMNEVHSPNPFCFFCQRCTYKAKRKSDIQLHYANLWWFEWFVDAGAILYVLADRGTEPAFACLVCGRRYAHEGSLQRHLKYECGKEPQFQCPHCTYRSKRKSNLERHMHDLHDPNPKLFTCQFCPFTSKQEANIVWHVYTHINFPVFLDQLRQPSYSCQNCCKNYQHAQSLQRHLDYECGREPQFQCKLCSYRAKQKVHLKRHMNEVHNPNPFTYYCHHCSYKSKRKSDLQLHYVLHHSDITP